MLKYVSVLYLPRNKNGICEHTTKWPEWTNYWRDMKVFQNKFVTLYQNVCFFIDEKLLKKFLL